MLERRSDRFWDVYDRSKGQVGLILLSALVLVPMVFVGFESIREDPEPDRLYPAYGSNRDGPAVRDVVAGVGSATSRESSEGARQYSPHRPDLQVGQPKSDVVSPMGNKVSILGPKKSPGPKDLVSSSVRVSTMVSRSTASLRQKGSTTVSLERSSTAPRRRATTTIRRRSSTVSMSSTTRPSATTTQPQEATTPTTHRGTTVGNPTTTALKVRPKETVGPQLTVLAAEIDD